MTEIINAPSAQVTNAVTDDTLEKQKATLVGLMAAKKESLARLEAIRMNSLLEAADLRIQAKTTRRNAHDLYKRALKAYANGTDGAKVLLLQARLRYSFARLTEAKARGLENMANAYGIIIAHMRGTDNGTE